MYNQCLGYEYIKTGLKRPDGREDRVVIYPPYLKQGVQYARQNKIYAITISRLREMDEYSQKIELDFSPLIDFPELEVLDIDDNYSIELSAVSGIDTLYQLERLQRLIVKLAFPLDFSRLKTVRWLQFKFSPEFKNIGAAEQLERLWILNYRADDLSEIKALTGLKELFLIQPSIQTLSGIEGLSRLRQLAVRYGRRLEDITDLTALPVLKTLSLVKCDRLEGLPGPIASLETLEMTGLKNLDFVTALPNLKALTVDELDEDAMASVLSSNIKLLNFYQDKNRYVNLSSIIG